MFVGANWKPCDALLPEIDRWQKDFGERLAFVLISSGTAKENEAKFGANNGRLLLLQNEREISESFRAKWTPTAVFINASGKIGSKLAVGDANIRELVGKVTKLDVSLNGHSHVSNKELPIKIGELAPSFELPNLEGKKISLEDFRGKNTLLLFWSVTCGYCKEMYEDLLKWEAENSPQNFQLLIVSMSDPNLLREQAIKSPILLEGDSKITAIYSFGGTPSGYLIDAEGRIASELAVGKDDVFALVGNFVKAHHHSH